jgi:hypothetical protein
MNAQRHKKLYVTINFYIYKLDYVNQLTLGNGNYNQTDHGLTKLISCVFYRDIN